MLCFSDIRFLSFCLLDNWSTTYNKRIESLEGQSNRDLDSQLARLTAFGLRSKADFDKYTALSMAESTDVSRKSKKDSSKSNFLLTLFFIIPLSPPLPLLEWESYSLSDYRGSRLSFPESRRAYPLVFLSLLFVFSF